MKDFFVTLSQGPFRRVKVVDLASALSVLREESLSVGVTLPSAEYLAAENGRPGRLRSPAESDAIARKYKSRDRWKSMSGFERLNYLRKLRRELATERGVAEANIGSESLARAAGVHESAVGGLRLILAGDFVPKSG